MSLLFPSNSSSSRVAVGLLSVIAVWSLSWVEGAETNPPTRSHSLTAFARLPLRFEPNSASGESSQAGAEADYVARGVGYTLLLTPVEAVLQFSAGGLGRNLSETDTREDFLMQEKFSGDWRPVRKSRRARPARTLRMRLQGANSQARATAQERQPGRTNYFLGSDPAAWRRNVPAYSKVRYAQIYRGVDLVYYGNPRQLEFDFEVQPGADPGTIGMEFPDAARLELSADGDLIIFAGENPAHAPGEDSRLTLQAPMTYQKINGERREVASRFVLRGQNAVGFSVADYDRDAPLVIDPALVYSTFLGGGTSDIIQAIAVDPAGNIYVAGLTDSTNFPAVTPLAGALHGSEADAFITKINAAGTALVYSTYLGGLGFDQIYGIAADSTGVVTIAGDTDSTDFPLQAPLQAAFGGGDADLFIARLNAAGSALSYSTYLGGSGLDFAASGEGLMPMLHVDPAGNAYVTASSESTNFPTTTPLQAVLTGGLDAVVAKLNPTGSALVFSTYFGGAGTDLGTAITTDAAGSVYVTGATNSAAFPTQSAFRSTLGGGTCGTAACPDAFVTKLSAAGTALVYSTYLGGSGEEEAHGIAVDSAGSAYVTGFTTAADFPTASPIQAAKGASADVFITKLNPAGTALVYSTFAGGGGEDVGLQIKLDNLRRAYVTGYTGSNAYPTVNPTQAARSGALNAIVTVVNPAGTAFDFSTYLGGSTLELATSLDLDSASNIYVAGVTLSSNFPIVNGVQRTSGGGTCGSAPNTFPCEDGFIAKYSAVGVPPVIATISPTSASAGGAAFTLTANGSGFAATSIVRWNNLTRPTAFVSSTQLIAAIPATDLFAPGTAQISVFNLAPDNLGSNVVSFTIQASPTAPVVSAGGVVNNASYAPALAPGSIAAIFGQRLNEGSSVLSSFFGADGRLATALGGARVSVNNIAAPLFYSTPTQLGIQIPAELAGQTTATLQITVAGQPSAPVTISLTTTAPGIFTTTQDGRGAGAITHANGAQVTPQNPARPGDVVIIYATGLGTLNPPLATGAPAAGNTTLSLATVTFDGVAGAVEYSGAAPGFVGLNQINARIPASTRASNTVPVLVRIGGRDSNTVTIAVQ